MEKDITTKDLVSNNDVFADIANVNLFNGQQLILPEDLEEISLESSYKDLDGVHHGLFRDTLKKVKNLGGCIAFLGFENQTDINRAMPVKDMGYMYAGYMKQVKEIVAKNNAEKNFWNSLIHDYPIQVISMVGQPEEIRQKYQSDYGVIAEYLAYYKDKNRLDKYFRKDARKLIHVEQVLDMLQAFSGDRRFQAIKDMYMDSDEKEECDTMCLLLDMCEEKGMERGMKLQATTIALNLLDKLDIATIAKTTGLSILEVEELANDKR